MVTPIHSSIGLCCAYVIVIYRTVITLQVRVYLSGLWNYFPRRAKASLWTGCESSAESSPAENSARSWLRESSRLFVFSRAVMTSFPYVIVYAQIRPDKHFLVTSLTSMGVHTGNLKPLKTVSYRSQICIWLPRNNHITYRYLKLLWFYWILRHNVRSSCCKFRVDSSGVKHTSLCVQYEQRFAG